MSTAPPSQLKKRIEKKPKPARTGIPKRTKSYYTPDKDLADVCRTRYYNDPHGYVTWLLKEYPWKKEYLAPLARDADYDLLVELEQIGRGMLRGMIWVYKDGRLVGSYVDKEDAEDDRKLHTKEEWAKFELCKEFKTLTLVEDFIDWMHETIGENTK
jgi:hypothetical protein